jgi:hypothetical protein
MVSLPLPPSCRGSFHYDPTIRGYFDDEALKFNVGFFLNSRVDHGVDEPIVWSLGWVESSNKTLTSCATILCLWNYQ